MRLRQRDTIIPPNRFEDDETVYGKRTVERRRTGPAVTVPCHRIPFVDYNPYHPLAPFPSRGFDTGLFPWDSPDYKPDPRHTRPGEEREDIEAANQDVTDTHTDHSDDNALSPKAATRDVDGTSATASASIEHRTLEPIGPALTRLMLPFDTPRIPTLRLHIGPREPKGHRQETDRPTVWPKDRKSDMQWYTDDYDAFQRTMFDSDDDDEHHRDSQGPQETRIQPPRQIPFATLHLTLQEAIISELEQFALSRYGNSQFEHWPVQCLLHLTETQRERIHLQQRQLCWNNTGAGPPDGAAVMQALAFLRQEGLPVGLLEGMGVENLVGQEEFEGEGEREGEEVRDGCAGTAVAGDDGGSERSLIVIAAPGGNAGCSPGDSDDGSTIKVERPSVPRGDRQQSKQPHDSVHGSETEKVKKKGPKVKFVKKRRDK